MTEDDDRAVIVEPIDPGGSIDPCDRARRDELARALGILRDIERSSHTTGLRADLLRVRRTLSLTRLSGAARAALEAAAWRALYRPGDARLWALLGGRPEAPPEERQAALRRTFAIVDDPLAVLGPQMLRMCVRETLRKAALRRGGRPQRHDFAQVAEEALAAAGFRDRTVAAALRRLGLRRASKRKRAAQAAHALAAWPRPLRH